MKNNIKKLVEEYYSKFMDNILDTNELDTIVPDTDVIKDFAQRCKYHPKTKDELNNCIRKLRNERIKDFNCIDVSEIKDFSYVFSDADMWGVDISRWNVSKGENFSHMFYEADHFINEPPKLMSDEDNIEITPGYYYNDMLREQVVFDISDWNVSSGKDFTSMFEGCKTFNSDITRWNVSSAEQMTNMFYNCHKFNQDISNWKVGTVKRFFQTFWRCYDLKQDLSQWEINAWDTADMFYDCNKMTNKLKPEKCRT